MPTSDRDLFLAVERIYKLNNFSSGSSDGMRQIVSNKIRKEIQCSSAPASRGIRQAWLAILGTGGDEVIHVLLDVMYAKAPYMVIQRAMQFHPTVAEYLPTVLSRLEPNVRKTTEAD